MDNTTDGIKVGDTVTLTNSNMGTLWRVLDFEMRVPPGRGPMPFAKIAPLGGGMTMKTWVGILRVTTPAVAS